MNGPQEISLSKSVLNVNHLIGICQERPIAIYGLFDKKSQCRYVGQSVNHYVRSLAHARRLGALQLRTVVLRWTSPESALTIEGQIIRAYWRKGQCDLNKRVQRKGKRANPIGNRVLWQETKHIFESRAEAGRNFDCTGQTILNWIRKPDTSPYGVHLKEF